MNRTCERRAVVTGLLLLLLASVGLLVTSDLAGSWIRAVLVDVTARVMSTPRASRCCSEPPSGRMHIIPRPPSIAGVATDSTKATSLVAVWPDCPNAIPSATKMPRTTAGGCQLDDVHAFLYGRGREEATGAEQLGKCEVVPSNLVGPIRVFECKSCINDLEELDFYVEPGGHYRPRHCVPRDNVAIIIPFRNRWGHLSEFLLNVHPLLQKQELEYTIYVIDQVEGSKFNRGMLFNVGVVEAEKIRNHTCYIFHDVDLLPENDKNLYRCPAGFHHYSVAIDKHNYRLPYDAIAGGVIAADKRAFEKINGYSNLFFGWGGEDDDFSARITSNGFKIERYNQDVGRYRMIKHGQDQGNEANEMRFELLKGTSSRIQSDGLNSLTYNVVGIKFAKLFTLVRVAISQQNVMNKASGAATEVKKSR